MFQTSYVHHQEYYYIQPVDSLHKCMKKYHIRLYLQYRKTLFYIHSAECLYKCLKTYHIRLYVQYSLPDYEHKMFETRRRQGEFN